MDVKVGLAFVLLLAGNWACDARLFTSSNLSEYAGLAVDYLAQNKTQTEIIEALHNSCSQMRSLKQQLSTIQPDEFCQKMNLCQGQRTVSLPAKENGCDVCHQAVDEIIVRLKDPDTKLDIIEVLLKGCAAMESYAKKRVE
ncbi:hypothetical protein V2J09_012187 [Rumex salicifolius]